jgi:uncharacterized membrane protein
MNDHVAAPAPNPDGVRSPEETAGSLGVNARLAVLLTKGVGTMWSVYVTVVIVLGWVALATWGPLHASDRYPFPFLLFIGNVVQLLLVFVILVGQQVLGRASDRRAQETYDDAEELFRQVTVLHDHMVEQDRILNRGISLVERQPHPWIADRAVTPPATVADQYVGRNGRIAAWLTNVVGSMWAFYVASIVQFGWIGLAQAGLISFDPYPFAFLLFLSSLAQLIFMFVIMVGQDVLGRTGERRAQMTYQDAEAVLHETVKLQEHLTAQDKLIVSICTYIQEHAPADHPIHKEFGHRHATATKKSTSS